MKSSAGSGAKRIGRFFRRTLLVILAFAVLGALVPSIPVLGSIGPLLTSPFGSWIVILCLAGLMVELLRWKAERYRSALVMGLLAGFAALGTAVIEQRQIAVARANGIEIDLGRTLWLGSVSHTSSPPVLAQYSTDGGRPLRLAIYRPGPASSDRPAPIIVYVHGGGWGGGTLYDKQPDMRWFADRGYLVLSVEYALSSTNRHTWNVAEPQVGCALAWISGNAQRLGGDTNRLALLGESAGGNLVVNVAYRASAGRMKPACAGKLPRIAAVVAPYPVLDAERMYANTDVIAGPFARKMTGDYTGGTLQQYPARYTAISSPTHVVASAPPTLLLPGLADHLLPPAVANAFAAKAQAAGIDIRIIGFPHGEHSFDQMSGSIGSQFMRGATLQFLSRNGVAPDGCQVPVAKAAAPLTVGCHQR